MRIAVFAPNLIGDTVMATPFFRSLRKGFPEARITLVIRPGVEPTLDGAPWFDSVIRFDHRSRDRAVRSWAVARALRSERTDWALLLPNSFRSALTARMAGARRRVGYARGGRSLLLTDTLDPPRDRHGRFIPVPALDYYLKLLRVIDCPVDSIRTELFTTRDDEIAADRAWEELGLKPDEPVVCFNTGGAFGPAKSWPVEYHAALARRLVDEQDVSILVVCGPGERDAARAIARQSNHPRVVSLSDQELSIGLTKACIRRAALLVTSDSGPRHFAGAFGVPVVTLFGPTHIGWTRTHHPHAVHLQKPVPCGPCQRGVCPLGHHRCMRELDPASVYTASIRLLSRNRRAAITR